MKSNNLGENIMEIRETIGIILLIIGFIASFFAPAGFFLIIIGALVFGKNRLALFLFATGVRVIFQPNGIASGIFLALIGGGLLAKNHYFPFGFSLTDSGRRKFNPFTGKKHHNRVNDDEFLKNSANEYYQVINQSQVLDDSEHGQLMVNVSEKLIDSVESYLKTIGRSDFTQRYYGWDFHLIARDAVNAFCMPGGKIVVFSGLYSVIGTEEELAFILGHEMAHSLLDHSRTLASAQKSKNRLRTGAKIGSIALSLAGYGEAAAAARIATNVADVGSHYFLMKPWGRDQELEADKLGMMIIHMAGYDVSNVPAFWARMSGGAHKNDFFSTHPTDEKRINQMKKIAPKIAGCNDFTSKPIMELV